MTHNLLDTISKIQASSRFSPAEMNITTIPIIDKALLEYIQHKKKNLVLYLFEVERSIKSHTRT